MALASLCFSIAVNAGGVVKDQAEMDEDATWKERTAKAVGKTILHD